MENGPFAMIYGLQFCLF